MFIINKRSKTQHSSSGSGDQAKPRDKERSSNKGSCKGSTKGSKEGLPGSSSSGSGKKGKTGPEEPQEYEVLSTVIFKGNDNMNRRCALLIEHQNGTHDVWRRNMIVLHRSSKKWQIREETEENAANLERGAKKLFIKRFRVGKGADARNDTRLRDAICNAPVDNDNEEWNYLNWLDGALIRLVKEKLLTKEEKEKVRSEALWGLLKTVPVLFYGAVHETLDTKGWNLDPNRLFLSFILHPVGRTSGVTVSMTY